jgi:hypothetical protein
VTSIGEVKAMLGEVVTLAGESWQAIEAHKDSVGGAIEAARRAGQNAVAVYDGTDHPHALMVTAQLHKAEADARAAYVKLDEAQTALLGAQQNAAEFMSMLG